MKRVLFENFLTQHRDRVFDYTFYLLRNKEDAEDATQEVFRRLWQHWERISRKASVAWTMRAAHNQCVDVIRKRRTFMGQMRASEWVDLESIPAARDVNVDPEVRLEFTETQKTLLAAMETLPERTRSMLLMHYFQGMKLETIAETLGTSISTVKVTIHRGRAVLRRALAREFAERVGTCLDEKPMQ